MSQVSEDVSDLEVDHISPIENDLQLFRSNSLSDRFLDLKEYIQNIPNVLKKDFLAIMNCKAPSPAVIIFLLIPAFFFIIGIVIILLLVRIIFGIRSTGVDGNFKRGFIVFGDYGRNGLFGQQMVADQMEKYCSSQKCEFAITTGDNIYNYGVQSPDDILFKTSFEDIYLKGSLKNIKYYHVLGNHDWAGKPSAEIAYANRPETAWVLPDFYYDKSFDSDLHFVFLDTTPFNNNVYPFSNKEEMEPRRTAEALEKQLNYLSNSLENSNAKWKFVVGHHPLYSTAQHGDAPEIIRVLDPIFKEQNIDGYIAGHDHNQQHLTRSNIEYFVSGAASQLRPIVPNHWNLKWADDKNGFLHFLVSDEKILVKAIDAESLKVVYQYTITKK